MAIKGSKDRNKYSGHIFVFAHAGIRKIQDSVGPQVPMKNEGFNP